ncbi:MAG: DUF4954 family protein, partial [Bacteroidota bacterium]|nr:DUF4954 family protein [Bacteroidota bacterium]
VLNSLIFPAHEQHHNNSFLCAAVVMGQSNIPAGATIGSNHNSRGADGEFVAGRGFWPGLCVSIKHNTKLASFSILAKGDYAYEMDIPIPFSLISVDVKNDKLIVMPAYWFMYNLYALARNSWKYADRDKRTEKIQLLETDYLAPDSVNEMFDALALLETATGAAFYKQNSEALVTDDDCKVKGNELLEQKNKVVDELEIVVPGFENAKRKTVLIKVQKAYEAFGKMICFYGINQLIGLCEECMQNKTDIMQYLHKNKRKQWLNIGGQLIAEEEIHRFKISIKEEKINGWHEVHQFYISQGETYNHQKREHAISSLLEIKKVKAEDITVPHLLQWLEEATEIKKLMVDAIYRSREKDYTNPFRKMMYESEREMETVLGKLNNNNFIKQQKHELAEFIKRISIIKTEIENGQLVQW